MIRQKTVWIAPLLSREVERSEELDMVSWIKFFSIGVKITATDSIARLSEIYHMKKDLAHWIEAGWGGSTYCLGDVPDHGNPEFISY